MTAFDPNRTFAPDLCIGETTQDQWAKPRCSSEFRHCLAVDVREPRVYGQQLDGAVTSASGVDQNAPRQVIKPGFPRGLRRADTKPADLIVMANMSRA